jgi:hypothetical protein
MELGSIMQEVSISKSSRLLYILGWPGTWLVAYLLSVPYFFNWIFSDLTSPLLLLLLLIVGWQIAASVLIFRSRDPKRTYLKLTCMFAGVAIAFSAAYLYYLAVPGFIVPFLNNPVVRLITPSLIAWQLIGTRFLSRCSSFWRWVVLFTVFMLPLALIMRMGPCLLWQTQFPASTIAEIMARPGFRDLWRLDAPLIAVSVVVACLSFPGLWTKILRLENKAASTT